MHKSFPIQRAIGTFTLAVALIFAQYATANPTLIDNARWVNPMIGTGLSDAPTLWGNYGGTYPGAVSPWGMVQLSPETSDRPSESGYYYSDDSILRLTCLHHPSGYPNGSAGALAITFMRGTPTNLPNGYAGRQFSHANEKAEPGYYKVQFADGDMIETTAAAHSGMIRYASSSSNTTVVIYKAGQISIVSPTEVHASLSHSIISFSCPMTGFSLRGDTLFARFSTNKPLKITLTASTNGYEQSRANGEAELQGGNFEAVRGKAYAEWQNELACVEIKGTDERMRRMFYTALYHAMLQPCNVADVGQKPHFANYSPWDTFRTLHPLLTLLKPEVQGNIVDDMMEKYSGKSRLPIEPMTGLHAIPILLDSYVKGVARPSAEQLKDVCLRFYENGMQTEAKRQYLQQGFIDARHEQSVSVTAELAYDDWALMRLCQLAGNDTLSAIHAARATNYTNLWDAQTLFMLPRDGNTPLRHSGELGYQESNKWSASLFAPHDINNLVNLSGGNENFCNRLNYAFDSGHVLFDNETVLHYPWLYAWARRPDLAMHRVRNIVTNCFADTPGGIPGNDDLGSMSSWLAFAVMGIMPVCPGTDQYVVVPPMVPEVVLHLSGGKTMRIQGEAITEGAAMQQLMLNGQMINRCHLTHEELRSGGVLSFSANSFIDTKSMQLPYSLTTGKPHFTISMQGKQTKRTLPDAVCAMPISISNNGADGVCVVALTCGTDTVATKNIFVPEGACIADTLHYRLYAEGKHLLSLNGHNTTVTVGKKPKNEAALRCTSIHTKPVVRKGEDIAAVITIKNICGTTRNDNVAVTYGAHTVGNIIVNLLPGEQRNYSITMPPIDKTGMHTMQVLDASAKIKVYSEATDATVLNIEYADGKATDISGFGNHGICHGPLTWHSGTMTTATEAYLEFPTTESMMYPYQKFTMLTWVRPSQKNGKGYIDFFTKGDYTVLKLQGGDNLGFFAGGWGRGECGVTVPDNWNDQWHLVAGVCSGNMIKVYIDGKLHQSIAVKGSIAASEMPWNLGRNAEMPFSRFGIITFKGTRIYADALSDEQIEGIFNAEHDSADNR